MLKAVSLKSRAGFTRLVGREHGKKAVRLLRGVYSLLDMLFYRCNPAANSRSNKPKTDKHDARYLSNQLRVNNLEPVYHDGSERERFRNLLSSYEDLVSEGIRLKNQYKSLFRKNGKRMSGVRLYNDESLLEGLPKTGADRFIGNQMYRRLNILEKHCRNSKH